MLINHIGLFSQNPKYSGLNTLAIYNTYNPKHFILEKNKKFYSYFNIVALVVFKINIMRTRAISTLVTAKSGQSDAEVLRYARQNITQLFCLINLNKETKDLKPKIAGN